VAIDTQPLATFLRKHKRRIDIHATCQRDDDGAPLVQPHTDRIVTARKHQQKVHLPVKRTPRTALLSRNR
jgi:uncharacterized protein YcbX